MPAEALLAKVDSCPPASVWESVAARPLLGGGVRAGGNPASNGGTAELFSGLYQESHEFVLSFGGKDAYVVIIFIIQDFNDLLVVALSVFSLMVGAVSWPGIRAMNRAHQKVVLEGKRHVGIDVRLGHALCEGSLEDILNTILILEFCHCCHF